MPTLENCHSPEAGYERIASDHGAGRRLMRLDDRGVARQHASDAAAEEIA